eukprot:gene4324-3226_t
MFPEEQQLQEAAKAFVAEADDGDIAAAVAKLAAEKKWARSATNDGKVREALERARRERQQGGGGDAGIGRAQ